MPDKFDLRLTEALEAAPEVRIPADFTDRVLYRVPHLKQSHHLRWAEGSQLATPQFALWTTRAALALLILAMFAFAPWTLTHSTAAMILEFALTAEFVGLVIWTSLRPHAQG